MFARFVRNFSFRVLMMVDTPRLIFYLKLNKLKLSIVNLNYKNKILVIRIFFLYSPSKLLSVLLHSVRTIHRPIEYCIIHILHTKF